MRNPFTVFRRCRELEIENLELKSTCKDLRSHCQSRCDDRSQNADARANDDSGKCNPFVFHRSHLS